MAERMASSAVRPCWRPVETVTADAGLGSGAGFGSDGAEIFVWIPVGRSARSSPHGAEPEDVPASRAVTTPGWDDDAVANRARPARARRAATRCETA